MNGFLTVMTHELVERRRMLAAAIVAALLPLLAPFIPAMPAFSGSEIRCTAAAIICTWFLLIFALILGAAAFSRDLAENRLGFYFSRPLSVGAIWWGKLAGVYLTLLAAGAIILVPSFLIGPLPADLGRLRFSSLLVGGDLGDAEYSAIMVLLASLVLLLLAVLVGHAVALLVRSRSGWSAPVAAAAAISGAIVWTAARPLMKIFYYFPMGLTAGILVLAVILVLLLAGDLQLRRGRTDIRRGARVISITLAAGLLATGLLYAGYAHWVVSPTPADTSRQVLLGVNPRGPWMPMIGKVDRGGGEYDFQFLLDPVSGGWIARGLEWGTTYQTAFSADGSRAVWMVTDELAEVPVFHVMTADLGGKTPVVTRRDISPAGWISALVMSSDGSRLALVADSTLQVYDLESGRQLSAHRLEGRRNWCRLIFIEPDLLRVHEFIGTGENEEETIRISELDVDSGSLRQTGTIEGASFKCLLRLKWIRATDRLIVERPDQLAAPLILCDGRTGEKIQKLAGLGLEPLDAVALADGRIAVVTRNSDGVLSLAGFDPDGESIVETDLAGLHYARLGAEVSPGRISLGVMADIPNRLPRPRPSNGTDWETRIVDLSSGDQAPLEGASYPLLTEVSEWTRPLDATPVPGAYVARLFRETGQSGFLLLDPDSGELEPLPGTDG